MTIPYLSAHYPRNRLRREFLQPATQHAQQFSRAYPVVSVCHLNMGLLHVKLTYATGVRCFLRCSEHSSRHGFLVRFPEWKTLYRLKAQLTRITLGSSPF